MFKNKYNLECIDLKKINDECDQLLYRVLSVKDIIPLETILLILYESDILLKPLLDIVYSYIYFDINYVICNDKISHLRPRFNFG